MLGRVDANGQIEKATQCVVVVVHIMVVVLHTAIMSLGIVLNVKKEKNKKTEYSKNIEKKEQKKEQQCHLHNFSKKTDYLIVTEDLPNNNFVPNKDKKTNALIRFSSGVVLHKYPFFLKYKEKKVLSEVKINDSRIMKTYLYKL